MAAQALLLAGLALAPFFVVYARQELGVPAGMVGVFLSTQMIGAAVSNLLWGWLGDRYGNRMITIGVAASGGVATLIALFTPAQMAILYTLVFLFLGGTMSGMRVGYGNIILEMAPPELRPTCVALTDTLLMPFMLFPLVVGALVQHVPYAWVFIAGALLMAGSLFAAWRLRDPRHYPDAICWVDD